MIVNRRKFLTGIAATGFSIAFPGITRAARVKTFRIGHVMPTSHPYHLGCVKFAELVEAGTNGAIKVEVFPSSQIGGEMQIIEGMRLGIVDGGAAASGSIPSAAGIPRFHLLDMPYIFKDYEAAENFATGSVGDAFRVDLPERAGFHILGYGGSGFHQVLNSQRAINTPDDLRGIKLRVWEAPGAKLALELMGANPTPMAFSEVFTALQQGVVDGVTNSITTFYQSKLYEVSKHLSMTRHAYVWVPLMLSDAAFQSVGKPEQEIIRSAGLEATGYWRGLLSETDKEAEAKMREAGVQINQADQNQFRAKVETGYDRYNDIVREKESESLIAQLRTIGGDN